MNSSWKFRSYLCKKFFYLNKAEGLLNIVWINSHKIQIQKFHKYVLVEILIVKTLCFGIIFTYLETVDYFLDDPWILLNTLRYSLHRNNLKQFLWHISYIIRDQVYEHVSVFFLAVHYRSSSMGAIIKGLSTSYFIFDKLIR